MLTSKDIRLAYAALHGVTSIAEYEKYDLMNANQYQAEWLELPIDEFMVMAGFVAEVEKDIVPAEPIAPAATVSIMPCGIEHNADVGLIAIKDVDLHPSKSTAKRMKAQTEEKPKRKYTKKIK